MNNFLKLIAVTLSPNNKTLVGQCGVARGCRAEPHRAVLCSVTTGPTGVKAVVITQMFEVPTDEMGFREFAGLLRIELGVRQAGYSGDPGTGNELGKAGVGGIRVTAPHSFDAELHVPRNHTRDSLKSWQGVIDTAASAAMLEDSGVAFT